MINNKSCPKCNNPMKQGKYSGQQDKWLKDADTHFLKDSGNEIINYCCIKCGYLESYVSK